MALLIVASGSFALAYPWGVNNRQRFFPPFPPYNRGWLELDARTGPSGARVAYAGTNLPYYLLGVNLRNEVQYVNIDRHQNWLMHDYHREAVEERSGPATWEGTRPGWDRAHPDYQGWIANLRAERIQLLVVTRANIREVTRGIVESSRFPIERHWADAHPEVFELLYGEFPHDPEFRLYRVKPTAESGG